LLGQVSSAGAVALFGATFAPTDAVAGTTDFSIIDLVYATPVVYDHRTGGGAYNSRVIGFTANSDVTGYDTGDYFACGDYSTFLLAIKVKPTPVHANQTVEFDLRLDADSSTASGAGFVDIGTMAVNYGAVQNGKGVGGTDAGMIDDRGSSAKLVSKSFQYSNGQPAPGPYVTGSQLVAKIQVNDLEAGEQVIVRIDARIGCRADGVTGGIPAITAGMFNIRGASPLFGAITGSTGNKSANTYYPDLMSGATTPWLWGLKKTVTTPSGSCPGGERLAAFAGAPVKYCYELENTGTQPLLDLTLIDDNGTPQNPADDFPVTLAGLVSSDGGSLANDLASGAKATGQAVSIADFRGGALLLNTAVGAGVSASGASFTASDTAGVEVSASPASLGLVVQASLDDVCGNEDDADPVAVLSGTPVRFCYLVTNTGSVALGGVGITDPGQVVAGTLDLAPGASAYLISGSTVALASFSDNALATATYGDAPVRSNNDSASVIVPVDQLSIAVTASLDPTCAGGGVDLLTVLGGTPVYYCYQVTNSGKTDLANVTVNDPLATVTGSTGIPAGGTQLFVSELTVATADVTHEASALGVDPFGFVVTSPNDPASVDVVSPALSIQKTVSLDGTCPGVELAVALVGQPITTCYQVTNEGDTAVSGVLVSDAGGSLFVGDLPAGRSAVVSSSFSASVDVATEAFASGTLHATGSTVSSAPDGAALDVIHPALTLATTVSTDGSCPGQEVVNVLASTNVTWCYTVTNSGDVAVDGITVSDDQDGALPATPFPLAPGESVTLSRAESASADAILVALSTGLDSVLGSAVTSNQDPAAVNVVRPSVDIDLTLSLDGTCPGVDSATVPAGVSVTPCYVVTNRGDETLFDLVVTDGKVVNGDDGETVVPVTTVPSLLSGDSVSFSGAPIVVTGDGSELGTVAGADVFGFPVTDTDTALVDALFASIVVDKTVSLDGTCPGSDTVFALPGQSVTTCYTVTNTGDLPVTGIVIEDGDGTTALGDLDPRGSTTVSVTAPAGDDTNSPATAKGTNGSTGDAVVSPPDAAVVDVVHPALVVEKTVSLDGSCPGSELVTSLPNQMVTFCYAVTNAGDTAVSGVVIDDAGNTLRLPNLGAGQSAATSLTRIVRGDEASVAVASGTAVATGSAVSSPPDGAEVDIIHPALSIATTVSTDGSCPGAENVVVVPGTALTWCYAVTNTGDVAVSGTLASDERGPVPGAPALLAPGESFTFSRSDLATNDSTVDGVASGVDALLGSAVQSNVDPASVSVVHPAVTIEVTVSTSGSCPGVDAASVPAGTSVLTCFTVTNNGDDTLLGLGVTDADRGSVGVIPSLPAGGSVTLTGPSLLVQGDTAVSGSVSGADEHGFPVSGSDGAAVDALFPGLTITKTVSTDGTCPGGELVSVLESQSVTTCYTVTNTGELPLGSVLIDDGGVTIPVGDLAPGQSASAETSAPFTDDSDTLAVASGVDGATGGVVQSPPDGAAIDVLHPALSIEKTVSLDGTCPGSELVRTLSGHPVTWCYTVVNTGDASISGATINDAGVLVPLGDLAPGQAASGSAGLVATADLESPAVVSGTAVATGTPVVSPPDSASVDVIHPSLSIATTVSISGVCPGDEVVNVLPGTTITWCYAVTNTGDVAVDGVNVTDNHAGLVPNLGLDLGVGQTATLKLVDTGSSDLTVMASAAGVDALLGTAVQSNQDPAAVNVVHPSIDIDVTVSLDGTCPGADSATVPAGTVVTYCYQVGNLGDDVLTDIVVKDRNGVVLGTIESLEPGQGQSFASEPGPVLSDTSAPGNATAIDAYGFPVSDADSALVDALFEGLTIQKTASLDGTCPGAETVTALAGQTVTYCYTVTNSGDIAVDGITVSDDGVTLAAGSLAPGQSVTVQGARDVASDANSEAVASGTNVLTNGVVASPPDGALVDVVHPALVVQKTVSLDGTCPGVESVSTLAGAGVTYCYTVTNTGDTMINAVTLVDDGAITAIGNLAAGQAAEAQGAVVALRDLSTDALASGTVPATSTDVVSPPDGASVDVVSPALSMAVTASLDGTCPGAEVVNILAGTTVTWCYTVTNTGDTAVSGVSATDLVNGVVAGAPVSLVPGESVTWSSGEVIAADTTATGFAAGTATVIDAPVTSNQDPAVANVVRPVLDLDVTVSTDGTCPGVDSVAVPAGTSVTTCYVVLNPGDDTLTNVVVRDALGNVLFVIPALLSGESQTISAPSPAIVADTTVLASASGTDIYGFPASDNDTAVVDALFANLAVQKDAPASVTSATGGALAYTIKVTNLGETTAIAPVVTDVLPAGLTFVSASGGCSYAAGTVTCALGDLAVGAVATITIDTTTNGASTSIVNVASVTSGTPDSDPSNDSDDATTQIGTGATRTIGYYATHPAMVTKCLATKGGMIDLGFVKLRNELTDNEIDVDTDSRVESGLMLTLGILKGGISKFSNGVKRSALGQARMQAGQQMVGALCNAALTGAVPSFDLDAAVATLAGTDVAAILAVNAKADAFNNSKDAVSLGFDGGSSTPKAAFDDPTDPND
jgi:uncharacterized repeat protein (TIGR01451 family)